MSSAAVTPIAPRNIEEPTLSYAKFAPITANLLARKGEAAPSLGAKRTIAWTSDLPALREPLRDIPPSLVNGSEFAHLESAPAEITAPAHKHAPVGEKPRRVVVSLSPCDFERLGIAAVKKGVSRHDLVRDTVNEFLARLASELSHRCACLQDGSLCPISRDEAPR
jgi:hypothetical protein